MENPHSIKNVLRREAQLSTVLFAKEVLFSLILACLVVTVYILLYIGAVWNPLKYTSRIDVIIANDDEGFDVKKMLRVADDYIEKLDKVSPSLAKKLKKQVNELADKKVPSIGDLLTDGITTSKQTKNIFDWEVMESGDKEGGKSLYQTLIDRIERGDAWVGLYIPKNYSMAIFKAVQPPQIEERAKLAQEAAAKLRKEIQKNGLGSNLVESLINSGGSAGNSVLEGLGNDKKFINPIIYIFDQGRQLTTHNLLSAVNKAIFVQISTMISTRLISSPLGPFLAVALDPYFLGNPVQLQSYNLHPVPANGMNMATYISPVVLWVICLVTINLLMKDSVRTDEGLAQSSLVKWYHVLRWKVLVGIFFTCIEAQVLTFVLWCLGTEFVGNYAIYWLAQWYTAVTFLFMQGALVGLCGKDVWSLPATILLIIMLTTGGAFITEELSNRFFYLGRGLPFYHAVRLNRTIIFGSFNRVYEDLLILMAYALGGLLISYIMGYIRINKKFKEFTEKSSNETMVAATGALKNAIGAGPGGVVL